MFDELINALAKFLGIEPERAQEKTGKEEGSAYGAASIAKALKGADFPMSKEDIMGKYGDKEVEYHIGGKEKLSNVLRNIPAQTYTNVAELEHTFHESMKETIQETHSGIYGAASIAKALEGVDFPMSKEDILERYGNKEVEYHIGRKEKLQNILDNIPDQTYDTMRDLEHTFHETEKKNKK